MKQLSVDAGQNWVRCGSASRPSAVDTECPHCDRLVTFSSSATTAELRAWTVFWYDSCPACGKRSRFFSIGPEQSQKDSENTAPKDLCEGFFIHPSPRPIWLKDIPDEVKAVSATFVEVYAQSLEAESLGLTHLCGMGLRKALEYLIKDFCVKQNFANKALIEGKFLGKCIQDHVDDPKLKKSAERAAWLGNDETHYVRKWANKDIGDLKTLIRLTVLWIEAVLLTEKYEADMAN